MRFAAAAVLLLLAPSTASAFEIDRRVVPQPKVRYYVGLDDWRKPMDRVVRALNRERVGVRLVQASIPDQASIQVGRLKRTEASILAAHELGHASACCTKTTSAP